MSVQLHLIDGKPTTLIKHGELISEARRSVGLLQQQMWALKLRSRAFSSQASQTGSYRANGQLIVQAGEENPKYPLSQMVLSRLIF